MFNDALVKWALAEYLGVSEADPEPVLLGDAALEEFTGHYATVAVDVYIAASSGLLSIKVEPKPETIAALREEGTDVSEIEQPPIVIGMLPGDGDRYVVADGPAKGMKGYFARDDAGRIKGAHIGGRMATRLP
jgi:hypothetical protein